MRKSVFIYLQMMSTVIVLLGSSSSVLADQSSAVVATSEIPEKRNFILDLTVNPCQNFHQYVCGNVEKSFKLRDDRSSHTFAFDDSDERILEKKKNFFKNIKSEKKLSARSKQLKDYYMACMNEKNSVREEKQLVSELISEVARIKSIDDYIRLIRVNDSHHLCDSRLPPSRRSQLGW